MGVRVSRGLAGEKNVSEGVDRSGRVTPRWDPILLFTDL